MSVFSNTSKDSPEDRAKYAGAVLGLVGGREPMDVLRDSPAAARRAVAGLSTVQLRTPEAPGKWSIAHVLRHLADSEVVWGWRMRLILAQDRPPITGYDQDLWADRLHYADADPAESLDAHVVRASAGCSLSQIIRRDELGSLARQATASRLAVDGTE